MGWLVVCRHVYWTLVTVLFSSILSESRIVPTHSSDTGRSRRIPRLPPLLAFVRSPCYRPSYANERQRRIPTRSFRYDNLSTTPITNLWSASSSDESSSDGKEDLSSLHFLVHDGYSAEMIGRSPAIAGVTICSGWTEQATYDLQNAVQSIVMDNPILGGHVYKKQDALWIQAGTFSPTSFFQKVEWPTNLDNLPINITSFTATDWLDFCTTKRYPSTKTTTKASFPPSSSSSLSSHQSLLEVLFDPCELTSDQLQHRLPLFKVTLCVLPGGTVALWHAKVSHAVGDGVTFFYLVKQLSLYMSGETKQSIPQIDWTFRLRQRQRTSHQSQLHDELYPQTFTKREITISYGPPFLIGLFKNVLSRIFSGQSYVRTASILLLDKQKTSHIKQQWRHLYPQIKSSSNDVLTAAICRANLDTDIFVFTENARGKRSHPSSVNNKNTINEPRAPTTDVNQTTATSVVIPPITAGGNFLVEIPIPKTVAAEDPVTFRTTVQSQSYYDLNDNRLPLQPFVCGKVGRLTSLATISEQLVYNGMTQICTIPMTSFVETIPMDVALIFRFNKDYWGVLHNFERINMTSPLLQEILVSNTQPTIDDSP